MADNGVEMHQGVLSLFVLTPLILFVLTPLIYFLCLHMQTQEINYALDEGLNTLDKNKEMTKSK